MRGPFGVQLISKAWDENNTSKYWKMREMHERGATEGERAAWGERLKSFEAKHGEGKGGPGEETRPGTRRTRPNNPPPRGGGYPPPPPGWGANPPPRNNPPPRGGYQGNPFDADDFLRNMNDEFRRASENARENYNARQTADRERANAWAHKTQGKFNDWERTEYGGKTKAERKAEFKAKPNPKTAWARIPKTGKVAAGMYGAATGATAAGAAYVHHKNPNIHKAQAEWKDYNKNEKRAYAGAATAGIGGTIAGSVGAENLFSNQVKHKAAVNDLNFYNKIGNEAKADRFAEDALTAARKTTSARKLMHGGYATGLAGMGGAVLIQRNANNRLKAKKKVKKSLNEISFRRQVG